MVSISWGICSCSERYGHAEVVEELLKRGANVKSTNANGSSPLHYAGGTQLFRNGCDSEGCGREEVVKILLRHGAEKDMKDKEKQRPIDLVKQLKPDNWQEIATLLQ
jgi:ankyrin repeat protein